MLFKGLLKNQRSEGHNGGSAQNSRVSASHTIGMGIFGAQSSSMIIGNRAARSRHQAVGSGVSGSLTRPNEQRVNSNIYGPQGSSGINMSKSLENHSNNLNVERRYSETI